MKNTNQIFAVIIAVAALAVGGIVYFAGRGTADSGAVQSEAELSDMNALMNQAAPDFTLADKNGTMHSLSDFRGKTVVLFFNEGLMCYPACWNQMAELSSDRRLNADSVDSFSVVVDSASNWGPAITQMPALAAAKVLYDTNGAVSREYGMLKAQSSMHYGMFPGHSYVVIDPQGIVKYVLDDSRMAINNDKIVNEIRTLQPATGSGTPEKQ